jgi:hypothetical protein
VVATTTIHADKSAKREANQRGRVAARSVVQRPTVLLILKTMIISSGATLRKAGLRSVVASPLRVESLRMIASSLGGSAVNIPRAAWDAPRLSSKKHK